MPADKLNRMYENLGIRREIISFCDEVASSLEDRFQTIDESADFNQLKVIKAMQDAHVCAECFQTSTGYGYNDIGRDTLEKVYANVFHTEAALVRPQIMCGTHALNVALFACLRPGDELLSISGRPYDTLEEVIGIRPSKGSLKEFGVTYSQVDLKPDGSFDFDGIKNAVSDKTKVVEIQRSRGYQVRPSLSVSQIAKAISFVKNIREDLIILVDNCYGEFVEEMEPSDFGADLVVGSLIKNPGGGLAGSGGYIAGSKECIDQCACRLSAPGLGAEVGANYGVMQSYYEGLFLAPVVTASALKGAVFAANCYENLGFSVSPNAGEERHDIIQSITFNSKEGLIAFCEGIQQAAPVDSYVRPEPWAMPGYDCDVIMADGAFVQGSSIELSADGPLRPPFAAYFQGGLTFSHAKFGVMKSMQSLFDRGLLKL